MVTDDRLICTCNVHLIDPFCLSEASSVCDTVRAALGNKGSSYPLTTSNFTVEEEAYCESYGGLNIADYSQAFYKNDIRFIFFNKSFEEFDENNFSKIYYTKWSNIKEENVDYITYIVSESIFESEEYTLQFVIDIIQTKLNRILESNGMIVNRDFTGTDEFMDDAEIIKIRYNTSTSIAACKIFIAYYDKLFTCLDEIVGLKYNDFDRIYNLIKSGIIMEDLSEDDFVKALNSIYINSITIPRESSFDNNLFKEIYSYI